MYLCVVPPDTSMTAVLLRESLWYGIRLYAYLLGVTILGGASAALGLVLGWPQVGALLGGGTLNTTDAVAGAVLALLGVSILVSGVLGAWYKLIADAVRTGRASTSEAPTGTAAATGDQGDAGGPAPSQDAQPDTSTTTAEPSPEEATGAAGLEPDQPADPSTASAAAAAGPDERVDSGSDEIATDGSVEQREPEGPPEPSPEEIAFGPSGDGGESDSPAADAAASDPADEPTPDVEEDDGNPFEDASEESTESSGSSSVRPAGRNASADPLADRSDGE
jgi:hypothetical protein